MGTERQQYLAQHFMADNPARSSLQGWNKTTKFQCHISFLRAAVKSEIRQHMNLGINVHRTQKLQGKHTQEIMRNLQHSATQVPALFKILLSDWLFSRGVAG